MPETRSPRLRAWRGVPVAIWAAVLAFGALGTVWSIVTPLGEAPDETAHLGLVWELADGQPYPDYDEYMASRGSYRVCTTYAIATRACPLLYEPVTQSSIRNKPADAAPDRGTRLAWDDEMGAERVGGFNQLSQHPPGYYRLMAAVVQAERGLNGGPLSMDKELALLRLVNVAMLAPLPLLAWWAARRFGADDVVGLVAALATFAVPMLSHIGATLNNDNLLTLIAALLAVLLAGVVRGDRSLRTGAAIGVLVGLGMLTKAFAVIFPPVVVLAYLVGLTERRGAVGTGAERGLDDDVDDDAQVEAAERVEGEDAEASPTRSWWATARSVAAPLALAGAIAVVLSAWWYLRVRSRTGEWTPSLETARLYANRPMGFEPRFATFVDGFVELLVTRFWGSYGWYTVRFPFWWGLGCTLVALVAVGAAFLDRSGPSGASRLQRAALAGPFLLLLGFVFVRAWDLYDVAGDFRFIQGRYLFAGLVSMAVLVAIGTTRVLGRRALPVVAGVACYLQVTALVAVLGTWRVAGDGIIGQVRVMVAWGAWPGEVVGAVALGVVAVAAWFAVEVALVFRRPETSPPRPVGSAAP